MYFKCIINLKFKVMPKGKGCGKGGKRSGAKKGLPMLKGSKKK